MTTAAPEPGPRHVVAAPEASGRAVLVELRDVSKAYSGVAAVRGVSLDMRRGEILGLLGKNGAGKSTLIKLIAGAERADAGTIRIDGVRVGRHHTTQSARELGLAFMFQELEAIPRMSVADNISLGAPLPTRGGVLVARRILRDRVRRTLADLDPTIDPEAPIDGLPPAQQRMVMIARALYRKARLLVLDEPTTSLTAGEIENLHRVLRELRGQGCAIVYVSHRLDEVLALTDRVVVMRDGEVTTDAATGTFTMNGLVAAIAGRAEAAAAPVGRRRAGTSVGRPVLRGVRLSNGGRIRDVTLEVRAGEVLGLGGLVGAGRSEIVRLLAGADRLTAGWLEIDGNRLRPRSPRAAIASGIALLPEDRRNEGLVADRGLRENVTLPSLPRLSRLRMFPSRRREATVARGMTEQLAIKAARPDMPVRRLSGGNQQKVVLGKWLAYGSRVLLFDEPTQGIDVAAKNQIYHLVRELAEMGRAVVFISSDFSELALVSDRVLVVREGAIAAELVGEEVDEEDILRRCYLAASASSN